jgi:hypothetical protein
MRPRCASEAPQMRLRCAPKCAEGREHVYRPETVYVGYSVRQMPKGPCYTKKSIPIQRRGAPGLQPARGSSPGGATRQNLLDWETFFCITTFDAQNVPSPYSQRSQWRTSRARARLARRRARLQRLLGSRARPREARRDDSEPQTWRQRAPKPHMLRLGVLSQQNLEVLMLSNRSDRCIASRAARVSVVVWHVCAPQNGSTSDSVRTFWCQDEGFW